MAMLIQVLSIDSDMESHGSDGKKKTYSKNITIKPFLSENGNNTDNKGWTHSTFQLILWWNIFQDSKYIHYRTLVFEKNLLAL